MEDARYVSKALVQDPVEKDEEDETKKKKADSRAVRNYEDFHGMSHGISHGTATLEQVMASSAGVSGWSNPSKKAKKKNQRKRNQSQRHGPGEKPAVACCCCSGCSLC